MRKQLFSTLAVLLFFLAVAAPSVMAIGTPSGTVISNVATATYKDANGNDRPQVTSNTVSMTVQQVYAVRLEPATASKTGTNETVVYFADKIYNDGNGSDTQTFTVTSTGGTWEPTSIAVYRDVNDNGVYDAGTDTLMTSSGGNYTTPSIAADGYFPAIVAITVPNNSTAPDGSSNQTTISTMSNGNNAKTATAVLTTTVSAAVISATKTYIAVESGTTTPKASPTYRPGDEVMWTVTMTNTGTTAATAIRATDALNANTTFVTGSLEVRLVYPGAGMDTGWMPRTQACSSSAEACYDPATKTILIPGNGVTPSPHSLPAGATYYVRARMTINAGVPLNTTISNVASITYTSGASTINTNTNTSSFLVQQLAGVDLTAISTNKSGNPGDQVAYLFSVTNTGNGPDTMNITTNSSAAWTWTLYLDNGTTPGVLDGGDTPLTDTNSDGTRDTGSLTQNQVVNLLAVATIPVGSVNGLTDTLTVTGTSVFDNSKTDSVQWTTTVTAPVIALNKAIVFIDNTGTDAGGTCTPTNTSTGAPCSIYPGSVMTYRVTATNNGSGNAMEVIISDAVPAYTTYVTGSIYVGPNASSLSLQTDAQGDDYGCTDGTFVKSGAASTARVNLGPGATWVLQFKVQVQ